jgi:hypothetical protein
MARQRYGLTSGRFMAVLAASLLLFVEAGAAFGQ